MISVTGVISELRNPVDWEKKAKTIAKREISSNPSKEDIQEILDRWERLRIKGDEISLRLSEEYIEKNPKSIMGDFSIKDYKEIQKQSIDDENYELSGALNKSLDLDRDKLINDISYIEYPYDYKGVISCRPDIVSIKDNKINITDIKAVKNIYYTSTHTASTGYRVKGKKLLYPLSHLDDCNYNAFCLQLSFYMYITWWNNKNFLPGELSIDWTKVDDEGNELGREIIPVPYMKEEVLNVIKYLKDAGKII